MKKIKSLPIYFSFVLIFCVYGCERPQEEPVQNKDVKEASMAKIEEVTPKEKTVIVPLEDAKENIVDKVVSSVSADGVTKVTGIIKFEGEVPKFRAIKMDADPICLFHHKGKSIYPEALVLGEDMTMANVFVYISKGLPKKAYATPLEPVVLDQKGCMYEPHVFGVMVDQPLKILNPDGTLHNVHATPKINKEFNLAMPKFRKETTRSFSEPEFMFSIKCDVHPWMQTWVSVMDHPFFTVTQKDGNFSIENLTPGDYELTAWHEKLGTKSKRFTILSGENKSLNFTFSK
ncbi:MAG: hypothetical protein ACI9E5_000762 [Candidatus Omnitrophota bacterium]|jgi:hypothetical protein